MRKQKAVKLQESVQANKPTEKKAGLMRLFIAILLPALLFGLIGACNNPNVISIGDNNQGSDEQKPANERKYKMLAKSNDNDDSDAGASGNQRILSPASSNNNGNAPFKFFPLSFVPAVYFGGGFLKFGAPRSGGSRLHAGVDLLAKIGTPIYAIGDGMVLDFYLFYRATYAMVVQHGKRIVLYGEVSSHEPGLDPGAAVRAGQVIAHVGNLRPASMLHFEMYEGTAKGPLTVESNPPYKRRKDLMNPTNSLLALRKNLPK